MQRQAEQKTRREMRLFEIIHAKTNDKNADIDEKIRASLTQKIINRKVDNTLFMAVLLGYHDLYGKMQDTTFEELIGEIPTLAAVNFVVAHLDEVMYGQNDPRKLQKQLIELSSFLTYREKRILYNQLTRFDAIMLFSNTGCFRFIYYAMQNYHSMPVGDYVLTHDDIRQIYKCLTYCNQITTNEQSKNLAISKDKVIDALLAVDMPVAEFKTYKFFLTQLVKALRFFEFCENPMEGDSAKAIAMREDYGHYLQHFYQDMGVPDWKQYLKSLMLMILNHVKRENGRFITVKDGEKDPFIKTMLVDPTVFREMDYPQALKYLRGHFLLQMNAGWDTEGMVPDNTYLLLNSNLLVDRLYQGLLFSFCDSMNRYRKSVGQKKIGFPVFKSTLGENFTERRLFYPIMQRTFNNVRYRHLAGNALKEHYHMDGTSDYYIIVENKLMLFEFKDALLGDDVKYSHDMQLIKSEVIHRLCNPGSDAKDDNRKGVYQLLDTIQDLDTSNKYDEVGIRIENIKTVYPILVITDSAFSANGVNAIITREYQTSALPQYSFIHGFKLNTPIIINIDTLMNIAHRISTGFWKFEDMLDGYLKSATVHEIAAATTFDGFVIDEYIHKTKFDEKGATYIFGDDLKPLIDY